MALSSNRRIRRGANVGIWAEAFIKTYQERINSYRLFEPIPGNSNLLRKRIDNILGQLVEQVDVNECALGDAVGELNIHYDREVSTLASIRNKRSEFGVHSIDLDQTRKVPVSTIDTFLAADENKLLHLVKIDVEGYEMNVLKGAMNALEGKRIKNIFFEFGVHQTKNGESLKDFYEFLRGFGFDVYVSARGPNFFGHARVDKYSDQLEPGGKSVQMVLATLEGPDPDYRGPNVVGAPIT
ncbi:MAG: FkbM family methyltransferase [Pseudomonadota bacterium]